MNCREHIEQIVALQAELAAARQENLVLAVRLDQALAKLGDERRVVTDLARVDREHGVEIRNGSGQVIAVVPTRPPMDRDTRAALVAEVSKVPKGVRRGCHTRIRTVATDDAEVS